MKYLLIILLIVGFYSANAQKKDTIVDNKWAGWPTPKLQYDTVDVICLVSDTSENRWRVFDSWDTDSTMKFLETGFPIHLKAKAVIIKEALDRNLIGDRFIQKYIGIPSRYIIWQTKILK